MGYDADVTTPQLTGCGPGAAISCQNGPEPGERAGAFSPALLSHWTGITGLPAATGNPKVLSTLPATGPQALRKGDLGSASPGLPPQKSATEGKQALRQGGKGPLTRSQGAGKSGWRLGGGDMEAEI